MVCKHCGKDPEVEPKAELDWLLQNRFDVFWKLFPRREDKGHAIKAFKRHVTSEDKFALIMKALSQQLPELLKRDRKHIPYPATWLNGLHWENDATPDVANATKRVATRVIACELCGDTGTISSFPNADTMALVACSCARGALPGLETGVYRVSTGERLGDALGLVIPHPSGAEDAQAEDAPF